MLTEQARQPFMKVATARTWETEGGVAHAAGNGDQKPVMMPGAMPSGAAPAHPQQMPGQGGAMPQHQQQPQQQQQMHQAQPMPQMQGPPGGAPGGPPAAQMQHAGQPRVRLNRNVVHSSCLQRSQHLAPLGKCVPVVFRVALPCAQWLL
jgi:hypothetical protein